jgi:hypothetical protein
VSYKQLTTSSGKPQAPVPQRKKPRHMNATQDSYNEVEAAAALGITVEQLYELLDKNIFTDGNGRPERMMFQHADLVLLSFWQESTPNIKILRMPHRK